jgi:hypothetical protein
VPQDYPPRGASAPSPTGCSPPSRTSGRSWSPRRLTCTIGSPHPPAFHQQRDATPGWRTPSPKPLGRSTRPRWTGTQTVGAGRDKLPTGGRGR